MSTEPTLFTATPTPAARKDYGRDRINPGVFSSDVDLWETPQELFDELDAEFGFTLDPCASDATAKCTRYFTAIDDGLAQPWDGVVFMNPPYGREIGRWVKKAYDESRRGAVVVCLIPARTDTAYWHDYVMRADEIRFIRGRLHFGGQHERTAHNAPFPSAVVVFGVGRPPLMKGMSR
jgi:site-specific DNA-methyltransferase (adenine-specific)